MVTAATLAGENQRAAVRREVTVGAVTVAGDDAFCRAAISAHAVDLRAAGAVGGKVDVVAVRREGRLGVNRAVVGQAGFATAGEVEQVDVGVVVV